MVTGGGIPTGVARGPATHAYRHYRCVCRLLQWRVAKIRALTRTAAFIPRLTAAIDPLAMSIATIRAPVVRPSPHIPLRFSPEQGMRDADLPRQDRAQSVRAFRCRATTMAIPGSTVLTNSRERR